MNIFRLLESFSGGEQHDGWVDSQGATSHTAHVGKDAHAAAYNILELTPAQRRELDRNGELAIDTPGGGVTYVKVG